MKYEAVIFDLFGTIVDYLPTEEYERRNREVADLLGVPLDVYMKTWGETRDYRDEGRFGSIELDVEHLCQLLGIRAAQRQITKAARASLDLNTRNLQPRAGAVETLTALKSAGYKLGLLSDCALDIPRLWPDTPFHPLFDASIFSCEIGIRKPDPRAYHLICERLGVLPKRCVYVGDGGSQELSGAQRLGMYPVRVVHTGLSISDPLPLGMEPWEGPVIAQLIDVLAIAGIGG